MDQWIMFMTESVLSKMYPLYKCVFGYSTEVTAAEFKDCDKMLKDAVKNVDKELVNNEWIAGTAAPSFADYAMACYLAIPFQTMLD